MLFRSAEKSSWPLFLAHAQTPCTALQTLQTPAPADWSPECTTSTVNAILLFFFAMDAKCFDTECLPDSSVLYTNERRTCVLHKSFSPLCTTADPARRLCPSVWPNVTGTASATRFLVRPGSAALLYVSAAPTGSRTQLAVLLAVPTRQNTPVGTLPFFKKLDRCFLV